MMLKFLLAAVTIASVAADDDATCAATDAAKPKWSTVSNECLAAATDDTTCAAIDAAKSKWLASAGGGSCVACTGLPGAKDKNGNALPSGCTDDGSGSLCTGKSNSCAKAKVICSKVTPNTCVPAGRTDATCAAIDAALPIVHISPTGEHYTCVKCVSNDDGTSTGLDGTGIFNKGCTTTDVCSSNTPARCVAKGVDDATCAAFDAAKPKWSTVSKKCVAAATNDATCAAIDAAKPKLACVATSPVTVTCGVGTALTANKCEIISPTEVELAKMCGEGTTFDKAKKKCITDPTSRCTTNAAAAKESAGSRTATLTTSVITATMLVLVVIPLY